MYLHSMLIALLLAPRILADPYAQYILTPASRTVYPASVYNVNGTVENAVGLVGARGSASFRGPSAVTYDFGKNIAGIVSFDFNASASASDQFIGISFTESSLWINAEGCDAMADAGIDAPLWFPATGQGRAQASKEHQRGGFRYLNVYHNASGETSVSNLSIHFTALPQKTEADLQEYTGYFHTNDEQLNRVWYAGAYTNELCTIDPTAGNSLIYLGTITSNDTETTPLPWYLNYTIATGKSVLVDGAKRDRLVWPGDMSIATPSIFVSTNELSTIRDSLDSLLRLQNSSTGALPYAGVPFSEVLPIFSFTYHLYSLIGIYDYYLYSGNLSYVSSNWEKFKFGLNYSTSFIDASGMANVTTSADWLRFGMGGHNIEANAILFYTLNLGTTLAGVLNDTTVGAWSKYATEIKTAANARLWDPSANLYRDNDTRPLTQLHPQDGNAWAVLSNLTTSPAQNVNITTALASRWGKYGAPAPEAGTTVSPFISSFEIQAHYIAGQPSNAIRLMKFMWGNFMLDDPRMTNSTFIEGYSTNGDLHYAPYLNDPRISHAHGWATGPTSALTFYAAGLQVTSEAGKTWKIAPQLGGLKFAEAGFQTSLGNFSSNVTAMDDGGVSVMFETPVGTSGSVVFQHEATQGGQAIVTTAGGQPRLVKRTLIQRGGPGFAAVHDLPGGKYEAKLLLA
ncbi:hypothetical protein A1O1_05297 [Capronia coronata CBS 617.96]|uniref:Alpha-L-rhamnosidase six-hairpin glycosidase domain-containing protein n=1 Tax=Capronia coronata CBS 617.96 TaxID=1182541 RepID=W9Y6C1_9EURO|nr:uncharacterized protein A1O1_05297 [Capronia coronata CBS 617.96]EXJ88367.1 hypothetical protein A1O1_05297 [Capronia coronata CBS 617.96]